MSSEETPTTTQGFDTPAALPTPQPPRPDQIPALPSQPAPPSQPTRYPSAPAHPRPALRGFTPSTPAGSGLGEQETSPSPAFPTHEGFPQQDPHAVPPTFDAYEDAAHQQAYTTQLPVDEPTAPIPTEAYYSLAFEEYGTGATDATSAPDGAYFVQPGLPDDTALNANYEAHQPYEIGVSATSSDLHAHLFGEATSYPEEPPAPSPASDIYFPAPDYFETPTSQEKKSRGCLITFLSVFLTLAILAGTVFGIWYFKPELIHKLFSHDTDTQQSTTVPTVPAPLPEAVGLPQWEKVSAAVSPSVVTINVTNGSTGGVGSGVIYNPEGLIITNHHVIRDGQGETGEIAVTLHDQRVYDAEIVGTDKTSDLAVIKLKNPPSDLVVASIGTSKDLVVGQPVMAIGAPLGLSNTVTTGIISALDRPVEVSAKKGDSDDPFGQLDPKAAGDTVVTNAIQIDASINPGNSGGPLFNQQGQVIGINSSIASISENSDGEGGSIGLGFAIPADLVRSVSDQLVQHGKVNHAVLGVSITSIARDVKGTHHLGVLVEDVTPGGAADKAGIREQDMITHIDDKRTPSAKSLQGVIRTYTAGSEVTVTVIRGGETLKLTATLQPRD